MCMHIRDEPPDVDAGVHAAHHVPLQVDQQHRHHRHDGAHRDGLYKSLSLPCLCFLKGQCLGQDFGRLFRNMYDNNQKHVGFHYSLYLYFNSCSHPTVTAVMTELEGPEPEHRNMEEPDK